MDGGFVMKIGGRAYVSIVLLVGLLGAKGGGKGGESYRYGRVGLDMLGHVGVDGFSLQGGWEAYENPFFRHHRWDRRVSSMD